MSTRVAVVGSSPTWRRGMSAVLEEADFEAVAFGDLDEWRPGEGGAAIVIAMEGEGDHEAVSDFTEEYPHVPVIAVVTGLSLTSFAEAIRSGATATIDEEESTDGILAAVVSALEGRSVVPKHLIRAMAQLVPTQQNIESLLAPEEASWLRAMAEGVTVADLATDVGYSERAMFRNLKTLYTRIGARNRTEALLWASRNGVLD